MRDARGIDQKSCILYRSIPKEENSSTFAKGDRADRRSTYFAIIFVLCNFILVRQQGKYAFTLENLGRRISRGRKGTIKHRTGGECGWTPLLSLWIHHRHHFLSSREEEQFRQIPRHAVHHHFSQPLCDFADFRMDSHHRSSGLSNLGLEPHPLAPPHDQSPPGKALLITYYREDGRGEGRRIARFR